MKCRALFFYFIVSLFTLHVQSQTVGLLQHSVGSNDDGYVLFSPMPSTNTYLIDKCGKLIHSWSSSYIPGFSVYLLQDGILLRTGVVTNSIFQKGGIIEKIDWNSNVIWSYQISDSLKGQHHDIEPLQNGNILVIAWEKKSVAQAVAAGRNPANLSGSLWSEQILELQPIGTDSAIIVWEWHLWDHLVQHFDSTKANYSSISGNPQLLNINFPLISSNEDWIHLNSIDYNPMLDQILVSAHALNEIWIIDHSTTTLQATGHSGGNSGKGGDLLYRWGNPFSYQHGTLADKKFYGQHDACWIEPGAPDEGKIMVFNNGLNRPGVDYSSIEIISPPVDAFGNYSAILPYDPDTAYWKYNDPVPGNFYSPNISGSQKLVNGNVIICEGESGKFFEIDSNSNIIWRYMNPVSASGILSQGNVPVNNNVFRCSFYPSDYSGFSGHNLIAGQPIELNPLPYNCFLDTLITNTNRVPNQENEFFVYPNPVKNFVTISIGLKTPVDAEVILYDALGKEVYRESVGETTIDISSLAAGIYIIKVTCADWTAQKKLIKE